MRDFKALLGLIGLYGQAFKIRRITPKGKKDKWEGPLFLKNVELVERDAGPAYIRGVEFLSGSRHDSFSYTKIKPSPLGYMLWNDPTEGYFSWEIKLID